MTAGTLEFLAEQQIRLLEEMRAIRDEMGLPSKFVRKGLLLLRSGDVRELAAASYPHLHCDGGDFLCIAGSGGGDRRLT